MTEPLPSALLEPHPERLHPDTPGYDEIVAAHDEAVRRGQARYQDPASALWVMTALTLWQRGWCCELGCRHCPYVARS